MAEQSTNKLDHIVHLSPPGSLQEISKTWHELGFNVLPGGQHTGGLTENALVAFQDGTYIELITFTHPLSHYPPDSPSRPPRENHPWGKKEPGYIDFALLGNNGEPSIARIINHRAAADGSGVKYLNETKGGRTRKDGEILEWLMTSPDQSSSIDGGDVRGRLPFFCGDLTPRNLRVPHSSEDTTHPNTSSGIAYVRLLVSQKDLSSLSRQLSTVIGSSPSETTNSSETSWELRPAASSPRAISLRLGVPQEEAEAKWFSEKGPGLYEVGIRVRDVAEAKQSLSPFARIVTLVVE